MVECLVLIVIIFLFYVLLFPAINRQNHYSRKTSCQKKLADLYKSAFLYSQESLEDGGGDGMFPYARGSSDPAAHIQLMVNAGFIKDPTAVKCPSSSGPVAKRHLGKEPRFNLTENTRTCYYGWANRQLSDEESSSDVPVAGDRWERGGNISNNHQGGRVILYTSGKVVFLKSGSLSLLEALKGLDY